MVTNKDLHINLISKKYPQNIQNLIKRFRRPYPSDMEYIRRLDKEYKIIRDKVLFNFNYVCLCLFIKP